MQACPMAIHTQAPWIPPVPTLATLALCCASHCVCPGCPASPCLTIAALPGSNMSTDA